MTRPSGSKPNQDKTSPQPQLHPNDMMAWLPADAPLFQRGFVIGGRRGGPRPKPSPAAGKKPKDNRSDGG